MPAIRGQGPRPEALECFTWAAAAGQQSRMESAPTPMAWVAWGEGGLRPRWFGARIVAGMASSYRAASATTAGAGHARDRAHGALLQGGLCIRKNGAEGRRGGRGRHPAGAAPDDRRKGGQAVWPPRVSAIQSAM